MEETRDRRGSHHGTGMEPEQGPTSRTPRWVKVFGMIAVVLVLAIVVMHLTGRSFSHGDRPRSGDPAPSGDHRGHSPPEGGHR